MLNEEQGDERYTYHMSCDWHDNGLIAGYLSCETGENAKVDSTCIDCLVGRANVAITRSG